MEFALTFAVECALAWPNDALAVAFDKTSQAPFGSSDDKHSQANTYPCRVVLYPVLRPAISGKSPDTTNEWSEFRHIGTASNMGTTINAQQSEISSQPPPRLGFTYTPAILGT